MPAPEAGVRVRLDALFRLHGFRIVNDYPCDSRCIPNSQIDSLEVTPLEVTPLEVTPLEVTPLEVTLDGYDPEMHVGYEYLAQDELGLDVSLEELRALEKSTRIFVATADSLPIVLAKAEAFLRALDESQTARTMIDLTE